MNGVANPSAAGTRHLPFGEGEDGRDSEADSGVRALADRWPFRARVADTQAMSTNPSMSHPRWVGYVVGVLLLGGVWLFFGASLVSFDPADPPSHAVWTPRGGVTNWCGSIGASAAYAFVRVLGWGSWMLLLGTGVFVGCAISRQHLGHLEVRLLGVLLLAGGVSGLQAMLAPGSGAYADLAGGTLGVVISRELPARFGDVGTVLLMLLTAGIGIVVAFDRMLVSGPRRALQVAMPAARVAGVTAAGAARAGSGLGGLARGRLGEWLGRGRVVPVRLDDLDDVEEVPRSRLSHHAAAVEDDEPETSEEREGASRGRSRKPSVAIEPKAEAAAEEPEVEDDLPGAPQVFDKEALKEKIAALPIVFANERREVATEADLEALQGEGEMEGYRFPTLDLLENPEENFTKVLEELVREQAEALEGALREYRIEGEVVGIESGPVITLYDVRLAPGTKVSQLSAVSSDIARALKSVNIRIVPNQAGRDTVGIEVPNPTKEKVRLKELMSRRERFEEMKLPMFLGKDASGEPLIADLTKMPHMLIAGTTGSGKSVCMNTIIVGFLYTRKPNELKLVLVDPKMVEMSQFKDIPHLMCPVVTEMGKAAAILEWACRKMDERYELLAEAGCRDIASYNDLTFDELKDRFRPQTPEEEARIPRRLPYMVFVIDELADLMMTNKEVEGSIIRIAQKARAVGIHLILATQRPQANVVTGLIKSNMPCRISFKVASGMDSRIVLDQKGGELLLGQGDMLYLSPQSHKLSRAQATLVDDREIRKVVRFMRDVATPTFERQLLQLRAGTASTEDEEKILQSQNNSSASLAAAREDPMFPRAVEIVLETKRGSVSLLQRRLAIGYTRASRLIDLMGIAGIISDHKGSVARDVLITIEEWKAMQALVEEEARKGQLFAEPPPADAGSESEVPPFDASPAPEEDEGDAFEGAFEHDRE